MSADNWDICPACAEEADVLHGVAVKEAADKYGKVPPEEYMRLMERGKMDKWVLLHGSPDVPQEQLAEYYELGIYDGKFFMSYEASCRRCSFSFRRKIDEPLDMKELTRGRMLRK